MFKATTPTSAGLAQAFDSSGFVALNEKRKADRDKKLAKMAVEYDTKGVFKRDMPKLQEDIQDFNKYTLENQEALTNPSQNMDVYSEWQAKQSKIKSFITYSIAAKEGHNRGLQMLGTNRYDNEENKDYLNQYMQTPTDEQYADLSAFDLPQQGMMRNINLDPTKYAGIAEGLMVDTPPEAAGSLAEGKIITKSGQTLDRANLVDALRPTFFQQRSIEGGDLRYKYGEDEDGFQEFVDDTMNSVKPQVDYGVVTVKSESKTDKVSSAEAKAQRKSETAWLQVDQSSQSITEEIGGYQELEDKDGVSTTTWVPQPEGDWADAQNVVTHYGPMLVGGAGMVAGERYIMDGSIRKGMNAQTGKPIENNDGANVKQQLIKEIGDYKYVHTDFDINATDKKGNATKIRFEKGTYMPDLDAMLEDKALTLGQYDDAVKLMAARTRTEKAAFVFASTSKVSLWDMPEEDFENYMKDKSAGQSWAVVPYESVEPWLDGKMYEEHGTTMSSYMADKEWKANDAERKAREEQKEKDRASKTANPGQASNTKAALDALK